MTNKNKNSEVLKVTNKTVKNLTTYRLNVLASKLAFTLAEVLITLAIIGVVAVLTVPNLIQDIQERDWNTSDTVFIKRLEQSLKVMNSQGVLSGYSTTEEFVDELQRHFKIANVCPSNKLGDCFGNKFYTSKKNTMDPDFFRTSANFAIADWGTNVVGVQFGNGVTGLLAYNPKCESNPGNNQIAVLDCIALLYDVNGLTIPNQITKDIRKTANVGEGFADPIVINGVKITKVVKAGEYAPVLYGSGDWPDCEGFKAKYGTKYCSTGSDYYAGAVVTCGGINNMPTDADLTLFAQYLYNNPSITTSYTGEKDSTRNQEFVSYGFPDGNFSVWGLEYAERSGYLKTFGNDKYSDGTGYQQSYRAATGNMAVCVAH